MKPAIPYYRVSTEQQGQSGLGLEAQQKAVHDFAKANEINLITEFIEIESGTKNTRPVLRQALEECRKQKALLLIAKLDRLGRNVLFVSKLIESEVEFIAVDNPHANKLIVHILAAFAEYERDQISLRTKLALQAAKHRGILLGTYGRDILSKHNKALADRFAEDMRPLIENLRKDGFLTIREITAELNRLDVSTFRGKNAKWHPPTVHAMLARMKSGNLKTE